jgi:catechol 2,3-dioxygenase-like lactoylglutathione lyase family enzyme
MSETGLGVAYVMLGVSDLERSADFYEHTLGRPVRFRAGGLVFIDGGSIAIGLSLELGRTRQPAAGAMEIVFGVEDVVASWRALTARGVEFLREPRQVTDRDWAATLLDPDGHYLTIFGPHAAVSDPVYPA